MAKKDEQNKVEKDQNKFAYNKGHNETKKDRTAMKEGIWAVVFFFLGAFSFFSSMGVGGKVGNAIFYGLSYVLGWTAYLFFIIF